MSEQEKWKKKFLEFWNDPNTWKKWNLNDVLNNIQSPCRESYFQGRRDEAKERQEEIERLKKEIRKELHFSEGGIMKSKRAIPAQAQPVVMPIKLLELRRKILNERKFVDKKPYSHNIISSILQQIANKFGQSEANKAICELKLKQLGWNEVA